MPANTDPKRTLSDSPKPRPGWLAKCGILIPSLSVRDRHASQEDPNRLVMSAADRRQKKRKRTSDPSLAARIPVKMSDARKPAATTVSEKARNFFDKHWDNEEHAKYYEDKRQELLSKENAIAWDRKVKPPEGSTQLSKDQQTEQAADQIIRLLREYERIVVFGNVPGEALPHENSRDMGGQFLTNKPHIEQYSQLYQISKEVPKGTLLHLHFNAELYPERLLEQARNIPNMYIRSLIPLVKDEDLEETEMVFNVMPPKTPSKSIFSGSYNGKDPKAPEADKRMWMKWEEFREGFKTNFGHLEYRDDIKKDKKTEPNGELRSCSERATVKLDMAENWIKQKLVLSEAEAYGPTQTVNGVWARFNQATRCFKGLLNYEKVYKWYISEAINRLIDEKVMYAELRPMLLDKSIPTDDGLTDIFTNREQMKLLRHCVDEKKKQLKEAGRENDFPFGLKMIYCTPRSIPPELMARELKECIELKLEFPDLICGFDLVGAEDRPNYIGYYAKELVAFQETCKELNLDIPFMFHAGETLLDNGGCTSPANSNLYDAMLLNSKRIGHGFSLMKHPHLLDHFKWKEATPGSPGSPGICIELCPISNELLHLCRNIKEHPYPELLAAGIPCTINSDNPSLFSNSMSHEFYQVMVGAPTMSIYSWKQLALWSIEYSCLSPEEKADATKRYMESWGKFCESVVNRYKGLLHDVEAFKQVKKRKGGKIEMVKVPIGSVKEVNVEAANKFYEENKSPRAT